MLTNTADIELFLDRHYEDIYWVSENIMTAQNHNAFGRFQPLNNFTWSQFEWFCAQLLRQAGWKLESLDPNVSCDKAAFNSPADIIAIKKNKRLFVSCKHYRNPIGIDAITDIYKAKNKHQSDNLTNFAQLMTTNILASIATKKAEELRIKICDFTRIKRLNSWYLIDINGHKWKSGFVDLIQEKENLEKILETERSERYHLEIERRKLENQIHQSQNQIQILENNWQTETDLRQNIEREIYNLNQEIRINQDKIIENKKINDNLTTKISQQERELQREKSQNQIGTRINLGLLKQKSDLSQNLQTISHKTHQILRKKDLEKRQIHQNWQQRSKDLRQNLQEKSVGEMILFGSLVVVFGMLVTISFWVIWN